MRTLAASFFLLSVLASALVAEQNKPDDKSAKKPRGKFKISKETTFVTGPFDKDGYIDYVAALNEQLSKGVTPENNANVLIFKAFGPHPENGKMPAEFFKWLGYQPPEKGEYWVHLGKHMRENLNPKPEGPAADLIFDQYDRATRQPWKGPDYPAIESCLRVNEKPLSLIVEASKRMQYFSPLTPWKTNDQTAGLIGALLPAVQQCRGAAQDLAARAMLRTAQGDTAGAWQDLLACHRLGRHVAKGGSLIEFLVGVAIDQVAFRADLAFLEHAKLDGRQIASCLHDLQKLQPVPALADKVDVTERFILLEAVMIVDRRGLGYVEALAGGPAGNVNAAMFGEVPAGVDWDPTLKTINSWYDRLVAAMREKDRGTRQAKFNAFDIELKQLKTNLVESGDLLRLAAADEKEKKERGPKILGELLVTLLMPAVTKVQGASDRDTQVSDNVQLAFALALYHREHGKNPNELAALAPNYVPRIPNDLFNGQPLTYRLTDKGYLLYSVGPNGIDDGGRSFDDTPPGDDLVVRMPLPALPPR
jgi:hypothetical protein